MCVCYLDMYIYLHFLIVHSVALVDFILLVEFSFFVFLGTSFDFCGGIHRNDYYSLINTMRQSFFWSTYNFILHRIKRSRRFVFGFTSKCMSVYGCVVLYWLYRVSLVLFYFWYFLFFYSAIFAKSMRLFSICSKCLRDRISFL